MAGQDRWRDDRQNEGGREGDAMRDRGDDREYRSRMGGEQRGSERSFRGSYGQEGGYGRSGSGEDARRDASGGRRDDNDAWLSSDRGSTGYDSGEGRGDYRSFGSGYTGERGGQYGRGSDLGSGRGGGSSFGGGYGDEAVGQSRQGEHSGRGPRGYKRSDERIREDVCDRLTDDPHIDASEIEIEVSGAEVTLSGTVDSREARRHAEEIVEGVSGVTYVQNNLRVGGLSSAEANRSGGTGSGGAGFGGASASQAGAGGAQSRVASDAQSGSQAGASGSEAGGAGAQASGSERSRRKSS